MTPSPAISIQDLKKSYGRVQALRGVNLEVQTAVRLAFSAAR
jgi:ABC-type sugar transport system ATPase subunit